MVLNGGFESGKQYWRGDGKVVTLNDGNKVGEMESDDRRLEHLAIGIDMEDLDVIEIRFRARYLGKGGRMRLRMVDENDGATLYSYDLPEDGSWLDIKLQHDRDPGEKNPTMMFQALMGDGVVQIDDVWAGECGSHPTDKRSLVVDKPKPLNAPNAAPAMNQPVPVAPQVAPAAPVPAAPAAAMVPAKAATPPVVLPADGVFRSLTMLLDGAPEAALAKLRDKATAEEGVKEVNAYLAGQVKSKPAELEFDVAIADVPPSGECKFRVRHTNGPIEILGVTFADRMVWAYFPFDSGSELSQAPVGSKIKVRGVMGRCDLKKTPQGVKLNVDLRSSRLVVP